MGAEEELKAFKTHSNHIEFSEQIPLDQIQPEAVVQNNTTLRNDGNNVDIDVEMALLAKNTILYNTLAQITQMAFHRIEICY